MIATALAIYTAVAIFGWGIGHLVAVSVRVPDVLRNL